MYIFQNHFSFLFNVIKFFLYARLFIAFDQTHLFPTLLFQFARNFDFFHNVIINITLEANLNPRLFFPSSNIHLIVRKAIGYDNEKINLFPDFSVQQKKETSDPISLKHAAQMFESVRCILYKAQLIYVRFIFQPTTDKEVEKNYF